MEDKALLDQIGGRPVLEKVHKVFYDKIYEHPWLKKYFLHIEQKLIENQQTDFMVSNMGGGKIYSGALPKNGHKHMFITEELFEVRAKLLEDSLKECNVSDEHISRWLRIDGAFKKSLVKVSPADCEKRFFTDDILNFPKPN
ncbi:MAG: group 1 truncated hemoglobin [Nitrospina sp.]|nr:group 1 truncated hemoglobin [Nitrospina sp.]MBT6717199.1 group 1 truncated hemoglobin [Nitrospina sp.]